MGVQRDGGEGVCMRRRDHRGPLSLAALAVLWAELASGHPRDGGCPSIVTYGGYAGQRTVELDSGLGPDRRPRTLTLETTPVQATGASTQLTYISDVSSPHGDIMLGGGRRVQKVAAAVLTWEEGTTYGIVSTRIEDPTLLCLYELESNARNTGSLRGATGDLDRDGPALLLPYVQWTPSQGYHAMHQLVVLVFAIRPEVPGFVLNASENGLIVHRLWPPTPGIGELPPTYSAVTRHGCACLPNTIDNAGNLVPSCEVAGQWCDVVPGSCGTAQPFSGKVGGNYAGWDHCEPLPAGEVAITYCRYDNDGYCDVGTPLCPEDSDFDDCHCAYEGDGMCDEGHYIGHGSEPLCHFGSDSSDCCPTTDDGVCDEGRRCPFMSDRLDCFCATKWNSVCEEVAPPGFGGLAPAVGGPQCAFLSDQADCAYESQDNGRPVCPSQYEHNGQCDAGSLCPCGTDVDDCSEEASPICTHQSCSADPTKPNCLHDSCATSSNCHGEEPQYCGWWSDYSYTAYCRPCEEHGRTCSDFADAVEGSCDVCDAGAHGCAETEMQVRLTLNAPSGNGWNGRWYQLQACDNGICREAGVHAGSPVSTRDKAVYTFSRSFCVERMPCYRLDLSLLSPSIALGEIDSTLAPPVHGSQLTWQAELLVGEDADNPSGIISASGGYGSFMIAAGPTATHPLLSQAYCELSLCGSGVHVSVEVSPSAQTPLRPSQFDIRLGQRWTLVEEDNDQGIAYSFPVCEERQQFGAKPCSDVPSSGKLQYSLCLQPTTKWFRFTYFVSSTEDLGESGITLSLNGESVLNSSTFVSVRYAIGGQGVDALGPRLWDHGPVFFDDSDTRGGKSCSCDQGSLLGFSCLIDCSGRCASRTWLGDGVCHDEFNCDWLNHDEGDCYEHWVIMEGRQFNGLPGDWLSFSKDGHDQLVMVAGSGGHGVFSDDGIRRVGSDGEGTDVPAPMPTCVPEHQVVLGNASAWTVCATTGGGLAIFHGFTEQRTLSLFITDQGRVWAAGAGETGGSYIRGQNYIGLYPESESFAPCAPGLQPLLTLGDWKLCESLEKLCWFRSESTNRVAGTTTKRPVLKFYLSTGSQMWASYDRGHFLSTSRRLVPESFEPAGGSVTNGVWRAHTAVNGSGSVYIVWINGDQVQKSSGDSVAQFTSDCFTSGIVIAIEVNTCNARECSMHGALRFSTMWCGEPITTNADDWRCSTQAQDENSRWQHNDFVEDSTWERPRTVNARGLSLNTSATEEHLRLGRFTGDSASKWIWVPSSSDRHPVSVWCRYARQGLSSTDATLADRQSISTGPSAAGDNQVTTDGQPRRNSQVSGYVILGALLAASVAALTRKFFNQSWQQKLDGELHLGMVVGYEDSQFDYSTENPASRDVDVAVRQSILNRFGDDHEAIGSIIDTGGLDNLSIDSVIGRGARSVVYAAEYMGCRVALKQLQLVDPSVRNTNDVEGTNVDGSAAGELGAHSRSAEEDSVIQQVLKEFAAEVRMLSKLQHPNVIKYVGFTTTPHCLIIQEYAPNGDLRSYLEAQKQQHQALIAAGQADPSSGPLTLKQQVTMTLDIARGMEYLHGRTPSVLHRDLKSPNLLVDENLRIKITDFGLAREKDTTREGKTGLMTVCGTPLWTAPEILKGQLYNEAADVYSFSLCFWEVWSMSIPFHELGLGPMEVLLQVVNDDRRPTMPDEMPPLFADLVVRCWATDARERPIFVAIVAELETFAELSGFGSIFAPKSFNPPETVSAELDSIDSVDSLASTGSTHGTGSGAASSSVFSLESASAPAHTAQGAVTAL